MIKLLIGGKLNLTRTRVFGAAYLYVGVSVMGWGGGVFLFLISAHLPINTTKVGLGSSKSAAIAHTLE